MTKLDERVAVLEIELEQAKEEIHELEKRVSYYDKMALKWGGACMGILAFGAIIGGHFDKVKEKILAWFL